MSWRPSGGESDVLCDDPELQAQVFEQMRPWLYHLGKPHSIPSAVIYQLKQSPSPLKFKGKESDSSSSWSPWDGRRMSVFGKDNLVMYLLFPWGGSLLLCHSWAMLAAQMSALYPIQCKLPVFGELPGPAPTPSSPAWHLYG